MTKPKATILKIRGNNKIKANASKNNNLTNKKFYLNTLKKQVTIIWFYKQFQKQREKQKYHH